MSLAKTYNICVPRILSRRRGQYDLEDEFLWFELYISRDPAWIPRVNSRVTISDDPRLSTISLDCPNIALLNEKQNFVRICGKEPWTPDAIIIRLNQMGELISPSTEEYNRMLVYDLLFLKKAGPGIGGGFDVTPIVPDGDDFLKLVVPAIAKQNENARYRRDIFVLQAGIENPLLTSLGQKTDLRLYMLMVGNSTERVAFYACRVGDIRNTVAFPYKASSTDVRLQITNVAQNKQYADSTSDITRIFSRDSGEAVYNSVFRELLHIVERLSVLYYQYIRSTDKPFVTLIGLDAVVDAETMKPFVVELNRRPTVYTPEEASDMQYSSTLFMQDLFTLGIEAIADGDVGRESDEAEFVLVSVRDK